MIVVTPGIIYDVYTDVCGGKIPAKFTCTQTANRSFYTLVTLGNCFCMGSVCLFFFV